MDLYTKILNAYPELTESDFHPLSGTILLQDDGDGVSYIAKWEYSKAVPTGLKVATK
jgi:hypothetical protein